MEHKDISPSVHEDAIGQNSRLKEVKRPITVKRDQPNDVAITCYQQYFLRVSQLGKNSSKLVSETVNIASSN